MDIDEFFVWLETEPDSYELEDGEPMRIADEKQGGRRIGNLFRAAELALPYPEYLEWIRNPVTELGGQKPFAYVAESWSHLVVVLQLLRDPEDHQKLMGDRFSDIRDRAHRLAKIERQRT